MCHDIDDSARLHCTELGRRGHRAQWVVIGLLVDSEIVLSTRYGKTMVFINKTFSTETAYQQDLINRDLLSTSLIFGKVRPGMWCVKFNSTSDVNSFFEKQKSSQIFIVLHTVTGGAIGAQNIRESRLSLYM
jgi:hypothetical protein